MENEVDTPTYVEPDERGANGAPLNRKWFIDERTIRARCLEVQKSWTPEWRAKRRYGENIGGNDIGNLINLATGEPHVLPSRAADPSYVPAAPNRRKPGNQ